MTARISITHRGTSSLSGRVQTFQSERITLGRRPENQVVFDPERDRAVSGHHASVTMIDGRLRLEDIGSQNGTFVNNARISGPTVVNPGDVVRLGNGGPEFTAVIESAAGAPAMAAAASAPPKTGIGSATLEKAITRATVMERRRSRGALIAIVALLVLVFAGSLGGYAVHARSKQAAVEQGQLKLLDEQLKLSGEQAKLASATGELGKKVEEVSRLAQEARANAEQQLKTAMGKYDNELKAVQGKISEGEGRAARLMVEIQSRDDALADIRKRQDLSEDDRRKLVDETEKHIHQLKDDLLAQQEKLRKNADAGKEDWAGLVDRYKESMFLMVVQYKPNEQGQSGVGIGTCFCIRTDGLLATNSHVAHMVLEDPEKVAAAVVVQNATGKMFGIKRAMKHPDYSTPNSPDVALVQIETKGASLTPFELASDDDLRTLRIGIHLGTMGYPGELMAAYLSAVDTDKGVVKSASATFKDGWLGRILDFNYQVAPFERSLYIQHSASLSGGTSGSPVFNAQGKVMLVHNSGMDVKGQVDRTPSAAQICFGIRVDVLRELVTKSGW